MNEFGEEVFYQGIGPRNSRRKYYDENSQTQNAPQQYEDEINNDNQGVYQNPQTFQNLFSMTKSINSTNPFRNGTFKKASKISKLNSQTVQNNPKTYSNIESPQLNFDYNDYFDRINQYYPGDEERKKEEEIMNEGPRDSVPKGLKNKRIMENENYVNPLVKYQKDKINYNGFKPLPKFPSEIYQEENKPLGENKMKGEYRFQGKTENILTGEDYVLPGRGEPNDEKEEFDDERIFRLKNRYKVMTDGNNPEEEQVEKDSYNGENDEELEKMVNLKKKLSHDEFSSYIFDNINKLRQDPKSFVQNIEDAKENIGTTSDGKLVYVGDTVKVSLHEGEAAFDKAIEDLNNTPGMKELELNPSIIVRAKTKDDLFKKNFLRDKISDLENRGIYVKSFWKEIIKEPETAFLLMVVDDRANKDEKNGKRQDLLDPEMKYIGISSKTSSSGRYFNSFITLSK